MALPQPALVISASGRVRAANAPAARLLGQELAGLPYASVLRQPALLNAVADTRRSGLANTCRYRGIDAERDLLWKVHVRPVSDGSILVSFEDISGVEQAELVRREFVANIGHELRSPLTAMLGFIETLRGAARNDPDARSRFLGIMAQEAARMSRLVGDLLSLSEVEGSERRPPAGQVALDEILAGAVEALRPVAEEAGSTIDLDLDRAVPPVNGERDQLTRVARNLVENAIKYGGKRIGIGLHMATQGAPEARISVTDDGAGIAPEHLPRLTERFYRVDAHRARGAGGTGLGLAIVKHIVSRHRGRLLIESVPGQGSRFTVCLPALREAPLDAKNG
ncbi:ATP-binding protein [Profundibacterium mesophilum]|uniref:histidine kinase n=1 Tax=Profundibacterium mesophilum KAUST100406-0324 TaxID=1037889 RepID=A0A921NP01_9RHOB|nr:ATP-binding protein [Profundibacterium mesophilum]KAF0674767.1 putative two-component sensor histidine kinase [Profundibacterium mesophilum KAUST100406-0324]